MNTNRLRQCDSSPSLHVEVIIHELLRGIKAQQSGCSTASIIQSATIYIADAPNPLFLSMLSGRIREIRNQLKLNRARVER